MPDMSLRPRVIKEIHQQRLASRDHLRAVANILQHVGLDLDQMYPTTSFMPRDPSTEKRTIHRVGEKHLAFITDTSTNEHRWDTHIQATTHTRLVLSPDEGGPLFCGYVHLANSGAAVHFVRDELLLCLKYLDNAV